MVSLRGHREATADLSTPAAAATSAQDDNRFAVVSNSPSTRLQPGFSGLGKDWLQSDRNPLFWCATGLEECLGLNLPIENRLNDC